MSYRKGMVPTAIAAPLLKRGLIKDFGEQYFTRAAGSGHLPRTLSKWEQPGCKWVEFDSVDRALTKVDMVNAWREEEPESYYKPNLKAKQTVVVRRCERIGCSTIIPPSGKTNGRVRRYCSFQCYKVEWQARKTGRKRACGKGNSIRKMVCAKGHDIHGDNARESTDKYGHKHRWCHTCKLDAQRRYRERDRRRRAKNARARERRRLAKING